MPVVMLIKILYAVYECLEGIDICCEVPPLGGVVDVCVFPVAVSKDSDTDTGNVRLQAADHVGHHTADLCERAGQSRGLRLAYKSRLGDRYRVCNPTC